MITIKKGNKILDYKSFQFPGGEAGIKLNGNDYNFRESLETPTIIARIQNGESAIRLAMIKDALERFSGKTPIHLFLPYFPYARQDRVCDKGEAFSLKVFADYINHLNFNKVTIIDPHSDVCSALINNVNVITQFDVINKWIEFINRVNVKETIFVSVDNGANKKTAKLAGFFNKTDFVRADKLRDLSNGNIIETIVYKDDFNGMDIVVCDDIIDGGKSFIELAKVCKSKNCGKFILYGTHGIFSKGLEPLNDIDEIWTTDSFLSADVLYALEAQKTRMINPNLNQTKIRILELEKKFL